MSDVIFVMIGLQENGEEEERGRMTKLAKLCKMDIETKK